jgi:hypothetical protein
MALQRTTGGNPGDQAAKRLSSLGMKGILVAMARGGQIIEVRCEMPKCYCEKGRTYFDDKSVPMSDWAPNVDHYPVAQRDGGKRKPNNVRLSHVRCNNREYGWRSKVSAKLLKDKSLQEIADALNQGKVPRPDREASWTARSVRRAFVS